jgi:hypothetical protein
MPQVERRGRFVEQEERGVYLGGGQGAQQRRLSCLVGADQGEDLARRGP